MIDVKSRGSGYYRVYVDDVEISQHITEREAEGKAIEEAINLAFDNPSARVHYAHDYEVDVTINAKDITLKAISGGTLTQPDSEPDPIAGLFVDETDVTASTTRLSNQIQILGVDSFASVTIEVSGDGGYRLNGGLLTTAPGVGTLGDLIALEHQSNAGAGLDANTTLTLDGTVSDTFTSTTAAVAGDWQLAAGHWYDALPFPATAYALQDETDTFEHVIYPRPDIETSSYARHHWAHPSMDYQIPICIKGGAFPYHMEIDLANTNSELITGATLGANYNDNDSYLLTIPASTIAAMTSGQKTIWVKVEDQATATTGNHLKVFWTIEKNESRFLFIDNSVAGPGSGTFSDPYSDAVAEFVNIRDNHGTEICVWKEGDSQTTSYNKFGDWNFAGTLFPSAQINIPGESPVIDLQGSNVLWGFNGGDDYMVSGLHILNGRGSGSQDDDRGAFNNCFRSLWSRAAIYNNTFDTVPSWASSDVNPSAIKFDGTSFNRNHIAIVGNTFTNFAAASGNNTGNAVGVNSVYRSLIDNNVATNISSSNAFIYYKHNVSRITTRRNVATLSCSFYRGTLWKDATTDGERTEMEFCYNNINNATTADGIQMIHPARTQVGSSVFAYRNTCRGSTDSLTITSDANVSVSHGNVGDGGVDYVVSMLVDENNFFNETRFNADGTLTDAFYTAESPLVRGTVGHEIA